MLRLLALRKYYCNRCNNKAPCSTGTRLLIQALNRDNVSKPLNIFDYGCSNWRNSTYLSKIFKTRHVVTCDIQKLSKPTIICYPTHLPFKSNSFDIVLLSHILMFLRCKSEWKKVINEIARVCKKFAVVETYHCVGKKEMTIFEKPLEYTREELLETVSSRFYIVKKKLDKKMENLVLLKK